MKSIITLITFLFISMSVANASDNKYKGQLDDCKDYKISPNFFICEISKAGSNMKRKLTKKSDGSNNFLGKWFGAKSLADLKKYN